MGKKLILSDDSKEFVGSVLDLADDVLEADGDEDKVLDAVAAFVDRALPFDVIIPGPLGGVVEQADGPIILRGVEALAEAFKKAFKVDPERKAERKAARAARKAARKTRKED